MPEHTIHLESLDLRWKGDAEAQYAALWAYIDEVVAALKDICPDNEIEVVIHGPDAGEG